MICVNVEESAPMRDEIVRARDMLATALELLDRNSAPVEIGAHLDLVLHLINDFLTQSETPTETAPR